MAMCQLNRLKLATLLGALMSLIGSGRQLEVPCQYNKQTFLILKSNDISLNIMIFLLLFTMKLNYLSSLGLLPPCPVDSHYNFIIRNKEFFLTSKPLLDTLHCSLNSTFLINIY